MRPCNSQSKIETKPCFILTIRGENVVGIPSPSQPGLLVMFFRNELMNTVCTSNDLL